MNNFFNKLFGDPIFSALLTILSGILITIFYAWVLNIVCIILGCVVAVIGLVNIVKYFRTPEDSKYNLFTGLVFGALGLSIVFTPDMLLDIVAVVFGIIILYHGIVNFQNSLIIKKSGYNLWYLSLIFALVTVLAGILLIIFKDIDYIATIIGVTLIVEGALNTWTAIKVKKANE